MIRALFCVLLLTASTSADAKIYRSHAAKLAFCKSTGFAGCHRPGYIVDHVNPLACGGPDAPSNMQWQTKADAKAKDKWERKGCQTRTKP